MFAWSVVGKDGSTKYDSRYFRMLARYHIIHPDGSNTFIDYPLHDCTEEDLAQFYAYDEDS